MAELIDKTAAGSEKKFTKKEKSWILYDWANSIYATNIMAAIFPTIFVTIANASGAHGDQVWGVGTSIATFIVALLAPILGSMADFKGMKKKLFSFFMLMGVVFTAVIAFTDSWQVMLVCYVLSRIGFSGSCLFYDSFLTDVTTNDRMDRVSSWGYAMGYIGGSTIPFVISIAVLLALGYSSPVAQKFSILITSVWWLAFSIPFMKNVKQEHYIEGVERPSVSMTFKNVGRTALDICKNKGLLFFIVAYFFYIDGVGTIISISTAYGTTLGLGTVGMILALLVTQIVAMPCSIWFSKLSAKFTARRMLSIAIVIYMFICLVGFYMGFSLEPHQQKYEAAVKASFTDVIDGKLDITEDYGERYDKLVADCTAALSQKDASAKLDDIEKTLSSENAIAADALLKSNILPTARAFLVEQKDAIDGFAGAISFSTVLFWAMAFLVGTVQGGIQAVSRSFFGKLVPKDRSNEYFGFFDIFGKFASVIGPALYALVAGLTGRSSFGVLCLLVLFGVGYAMLHFGRKHFTQFE